LTTTGVGRRRNWVAYAIIGVFVTICAVGWAIIVAHTEGTPGIDPQIVSWRAADRSVLVHYEIAKAKGDTVRCALIAYDTGHAEIGRIEVVAPAGTGDVDARRTVPTTSRPTAVDVQECRAG
jgi:hypothetical protein